MAQDREGSRFGEQGRKLGSRRPNILAELQGLQLVFGSNTKSL
jgi:hypothetical protein